jgi:hypothetical protein
MNYKIIVLPLCLIICKPIFAWTYYYKNQHPEQVLQQAVPYSGPANPYNYYNTPYSPMQNPYDPRSIRNSPEFHVQYYDSHGNYIGNGKTDTYQTGPYSPYRSPFHSNSINNPYDQMKNK